MPRRRDQKIKYLDDEGAAESKVPGKSLTSEWRLAGRLAGRSRWNLALPAERTCAISSAVYAESEVWLPWSWWLLDHLATAYIILVL